MSTEIDNFHILKDIVAKSGLRLRMKEKKKPVVKENKDLERRYAVVLSSHAALLS